MPTRPAMSKKAAITKAAPKKVTVKKPAKGDKLVCEVCGMSIIVDELSDTVEFDEILCCTKPMKPKASRVVKPAPAKSIKKK